MKPKRKKTCKPTTEELSALLDHESRISRASLCALTCLVDRIGTLQSELNELVRSIQDAKMERDQLGVYAPKKTSSKEAIWYSGADMKLKKKAKK